MYDNEHDHIATPAEAVAEYARNIGYEYPDRAWLLHDFDVWVANPYYVGTPVPHPESDQDFGDEGSEAPGFDNPGRAQEWASCPAEMDDPGEDDIPF